MAFTSFIVCEQSLFFLFRFCEGSARACERALSGEAPSVTRVRNTGTSRSTLFHDLMYYFVFMYLQTLRPTVTAVRNVIDKSLAERDANIDKMCTHIDKDIVTLGKEVKEVKQKAQVKLNYEGAFDCRLYSRIRIRKSFLANLMYRDFWAT